ncbi:helix-turn-helix transcriptional regulator [Luteolibacter pohnpeiensis]|uniref:Helix-turn-helix transcriptional regulator n=1 Tax=Luteolibacter pohnpeiensis TaxID=454153 RepID=A0A934VQ70_9BACT|nr:helix-turn-helix transcriptional regulator [Luteolibacter pohnpeiensis]MBK1881796.1 helix-turn-helix transcriptional regulator [Luteolibacter pohnpeiensis]
MPRPKGFLIDGRFVRTQRENQGLTQDQLASQSRLTRSVIQKAERGGPLAPATIQALVSVFGCSDTDLIVSEDWNRSVEEQIVSPFKREAAPKIGSVWVQSREMLYQMPPLLLQALAIRNLARIMPVYSPRSSEAKAHFRHLVAAVVSGLRTITFLMGGPGRMPEISELAKGADACFLAAGFAKNSQFEEDAHAADAAFAVAIGAARLLESLIAARSSKDGAHDADHWRAMEFATNSCHASAHASVYLAVDEQFIRSATLDTHDLRNSMKPMAVLAGPLWEGGEMPPPLKLFMNRFLREAHFPHETRILWNRWVRREFSITAEE